MAVGIAGGSGSAHNATVTVENNVGALEEALVIARKQQEARRYQDAVTAAEDKITKFKSHLEGLYLSLDSAKQELAAYEVSQKDAE